jgi:hypothetical protein
MAEGLRKLLESEFESVTVVGNGRELLHTGDGRFLLSIGH